jgi:hypothetical protein
MPEARRDRGNLGVRVLRLRQVKLRLGYIFDFRIDRQSSAMSGRWNANREAVSHLLKSYASFSRECN